VTIAISLKINDGLVLAADSASTMVQLAPVTQQRAVVNVYNNANKIFNLVKGLPIGAITWGAGSINSASISTIVKDLRDRLAGKDPNHRDWKVDPENYGIKIVADTLRTFVYEELYTPAYKDWVSTPKPVMGFIVAGYSRAGGFASSFAEEYIIQVGADGSCEQPRLLRKSDQSGATWSGEPEALNRLLTGFGSRLPDVLKSSLKVPPEQIPPAMAVIQNALQAQMIMPAMPLQDAIDLAEFMVETTVKFSRFIPGPSTVGGPIEIAAISKHEGFRWIKRKYYFSRDLNPSEDFDVHTSV
jgi:hypothetical protein